MSSTKWRIVDLTHSIIIDSSSSTTSAMLFSQSKNKNLHADHAGFLIKNLKLPLKTFEAKREGDRDGEKSSVK
jgi:hypothetical protein